MSRETRTTAQEAWKQQPWVGRGNPSDSDSDERQPAGWDKLRVARPDHACPVCHRLNRVYDPTDICVDCRTAAARPVVIVDDRWAGIMVGGAE